MFKFKKIFMVGLVLSLVSFSNVLAEENLKMAEKKEQNVGVLNSEPAEKLDDKMKVLKNIKYIDFSNAEKEIPLEKEKAEQCRDLVYCSVNTFFKDKKDMSNFFAKSLFLNYVYDELIKELKKDKELEEYFNKKDEIISKWARGEETNEEAMTISLNDTLLSEKDSTNFVRVFLTAPSKIMQKIDDVFKSSERMKNIFNEKNFSDEKFEEIKNNAILFLEKEKAKIEENLNNKGFYEQAQKDFFKKNVYGLVRDCYDVSTIESFKRAKLKEIEYIKEKLENISSESIKEGLNDKIKFLQESVSNEEALKKSYEEAKKDVNLRLKVVFFENVADGCLKLRNRIANDIKLQEQTNKKNIEIINSSIKAVRNISKNDFEKVLTEVETEKANELLGTPREYID